MIIQRRSYVVGLNRVPEAEFRYHAHLYRGTFNHPGKPMCSKGYNRPLWGPGCYSIWRGDSNVGLGICKTCLRRAEAGRDPVPSKKA